MRPVTDQDSSGPPDDAGDRVDDAAPGAGEWDAEAEDRAADAELDALAAEMERVYSRRVRRPWERPVRLSTVVRLAEECDVVLVGTTGSHAPMIETDLAQRHRDRAGRLLPAHLLNAPYEHETFADARYGRRGTPTRTYRRDRALRDVPDE